MSARSEEEEEEEKTFKKAPMVACGRKDGFMLMSQKKEGGWVERGKWPLPSVCSGGI